MTRKDYILLSQVVKSFRQDRIVCVGTLEADDNVNALLTHLTQALKSDNAAFDQAKFIKACGL